MNVEFMDFLLLALASFRFTHLLVFDKITEFIRAPFFEEVVEVNEQEESTIYYLPKGKGIRKFIGELLSCYWCTGVWSSILIVTIYFLFPQIAIPFILILAIAGLAAILEAAVQFWVDN